VELLAAQGLEEADFGDDHVLMDYLSRAFSWAHRAARRKSNPAFMESVIYNIRLLRPLLETQDEGPPGQLVKIVKTISAELLKYLRDHPRALFSIKPRQFEELIAEILSAYGWEVVLTSATKDGGYDLFAVVKDLSGDTSSWIVECKKYAPQRKVGVDIVRALYGIKLDLRVANAMLATTSHFTKNARDYKASRYDLELRDYRGILEWLNQYKPNPNGQLYIKESRLVLPRGR